MSKISQEPRQYVAVYGLIRNAKGNYLILKRAPHDTLPGVWEMPGGNLEYREDLVSGVIREVLEETGLHVHVGSLISACAYMSGKDNAKHVVRIAFLCRLTSDIQEVTLSADHTEYLWADRSMMSSLTVSDFLREALRMTDAA